MGVIGDVLTGFLSKILPFKKGGTVRPGTVTVGKGKTKMTVAIKKVAKKAVKKRKSKAKK